MHPLVESYIRHDDDWQEKLEALTGPLEPVVAAIRKIRLFVIGKGDYADARNHAEAIRLEEIGDPNLTVLFIGAWADGAHTAGRWDEMAAILNRGRAFLGREIHPEIAATFQQGEGLLASARGDKRRREAIFHEILDSLRNNPEGYRGYYFSLALFLAQMGRETEVDADVDRIVRPGNLRDIARVAVSRFVQCVETGRIGEAAAFRSDIRRDPIVDRFFGVRKRPYDTLLEYLRDRWTPAAWRAARGIRENETRPEAWAWTIDLLFRGFPREALEAERRTAAEFPERSLAGLGVDSFSLLRCELANGNAGAARRILEMRHERGNRHYLDDLFVARIHHLEGDESAAGRHFDAVREACGRYRAGARLDFELRLACELSPADVMRLPGTGGAGTAVVGESLKPVEPAGARATAFGAARLVGGSVALDAVRNAIRRFGPLDQPVIVTGETGTGKEIVARALHEESLRAKELFLAVNCGAITESLLESELFGHEKGAFTGAVRAHHGVFEAAGKGTVFLDEIAEMPARLQVALLRVLEAGEIRPVGSATAKMIQCRIVAATNADLAGLAERGAFRKDLLFRLRRLEIGIPPLRERKEDILPLADHFLRDGRADNRRPALSAALREALENHPWPGNVRELRNEMERMRLLNSDKPAYDIGDFTRAGRAESPGMVKTASPASPVETRTGRGGFREGNSFLRRRERLRTLFRDHTTLTRAEIVAAMGISAPTVTTYLRALCEEGFVEKIRPSRSPSTHYFRLK